MYWTNPSGCRRKTRKASCRLVLKTVAGPVKNLVTHFNIFKVSKLIIEFEKIPLEIKYDECNINVVMANTGKETILDNPGESLSGQADFIATHLLEAYYFQDQRESHLLKGKPNKALDSASKALSRMAVVYEHEFPAKSSQRSRMAGKEFMKGLFLQDEIENWKLLKQRSDAANLQKVLLSDWNSSYAPSAVKDNRWEWARERLRNTCEKVGITDEYADKQVQFWLLHGQLHEYWEEIAKEAHNYKLRAMVPNPSVTDENRLGEDFVRGVKHHNEWQHRDLGTDIEPLKEIVVPYYERILELQENV